MCGTSAFAGDSVKNVERCVECRKRKKEHELREAPVSWMYEGVREGVRGRETEGD